MPGPRWRNPDCGSLRGLRLFIVVTRLKPGPCADSDRQDHGAGRQGWQFPLEGGVTLDPEARRFGEVESVAAGIRLEGRSGSGFGRAQLIRRRKRVQVNFVSRQPDRLATRGLEWRNLRLNGGLGHGGRHRLRLGWRYRKWRGRHCWPGRRADQEGRPFRRHLRRRRRRLGLQAGRNIVRLALGSIPERFERDRHFGEAAEGARPKRVELLGERLCDFLAARRRSQPKHLIMVRPRPDRAVHDDPSREPLCRLPSVGTFYAFAR